MRKARSRNVVARSVADFVVAFLCGCTAMTTKPEMGVHDAPVRAVPGETTESAPTVSAAVPASKPASIDPERVAHHARRDVEAFFGESYPRAYEFKVFPNRAAFNDFARTRWGMEKTECWMVAMGVGSMMVLLSPDAWKSDACEHEPTERHVREIITHELVHVFHGQHNPNPDFDGMDDAGWFVEGLAILAAGQLDQARVSRVRDAAAAGQIPKRLAEAWSGANRYGICGSLVSFVDGKWGRGKVRELLAKTTNTQILEALGVSEQALLDSWRESVLRN